MEHLGPPGVSDTAVNEESEENIEDHSACHDHQASESTLGSELIRLWFALECIGIHRFIDHPRDLAIATEGDPTKSIDGTTTLALPLKEGEPRVEEEVELLHTCPKETSHEVVPKLVNEHEDRER